MPSTRSGQAPRAGQDQHRHMPPGNAPAPQHGEAIHGREAEIENDEVVGLGIAAKPGVLAIGGMIDDIASAGQRRFHVTGDPRLVLDNENAHQSSSSILRILPVAALTSIS